MSNDATRAIAATYSAIAPDYEQLWAPVLRPHTMRLLDLLPLAGARLVLDLGTGVGTMLGELAGRAPRASVVGTDLSQGMLALAPRRFPRVLADAMSLPFADASFDVVVSAFVLFNVPDPVVALAGVRGCLRPGGAFGMTTWGDAADSQEAPAYEVFTQELDRAGAAPDPAGAIASSREALGAEDRLDAALASAGFEDRAIEVTAFEHALDAEAFVRERSKLGPTRRRLDTLGPSDREACLALATERIAAMPPADLIDRDLILMGTGYVAS